MKTSDQLNEILMPDEKLLWSGRPDVLQTIAYGGWIEAGMVFVVLGFAGVYFPYPVPPAFVNIPQYAPIWSWCCLSLGVLTILVSSFCFIVWAHTQFYAITNKRLLFGRLPFFDKKASMNILVIEPDNINSIAVAPEINQIGCVNIALQATQRLSILLGAECHLDHIHKPIEVSQLIALTFNKPIATRTITWPLSDVYMGCQVCAQSLYWPAKGSSQALMLIKVFSIWLGLTLLLWFWVGAIPHSFFWTAFLVVGIVAVTQGLLLFLRDNLSR